MIDKPRDIILFFTPEAGVIPHYAAQCLLARTMQDRGYEVLLARCSGVFSRCPVMDMVSVPYDFTGEGKLKLCGDCQCVSGQVSRLYGLRCVEVGSFVTPKMQSRISEAVQNAPSDLRSFVFDGVHFGKLVAGDLVCATKCSNFDDLEDQFRYAWLRYIESSMLAYLAVQAACHCHGITRILCHNEYSLNLGALMAGRKLSIPTFSVTHAAHLNVDRRRFVVVPEVLSRARDRVIESWDTWRNLTLSTEQVREVGDDILSRLGARGSHVYSPGKTVKQNELFERIKFSRDRKLIVAFTSSLDEWLAREMNCEGMGQALREMRSPFKDQLDWLHQVTAFVGKSDDLQLVVRVHPREGGNKRERAISQHLLRLKAAFDREMAHCHFIWPEDRISSYDLVEIADLVLTSWTTVGFEAARLGVPVLKAFGNFGFPDDDFLVWASTVKEYFEQLSCLFTATVCEDRLLRAFRCHHAFVLGSSLDLGDVVPNSDFGGFPAFHLPREASAIEEIIVSQKSPMEINCVRMSAEQHPRRAVQEKEELRRQLFRIIHYLHTGVDCPISNLIVENRQAVVSTSDKIDDHFPSVPDEARIAMCGKMTEYRFAGQTFHRYSPLVARLAHVCALPLTSSRKRIRTQFQIDQQGRKKSLFLNTFYPRFIECHYQTYPNLRSDSYQEQLMSLTRQLFGDSDFYSRGLKQAEWDADDLIVNCQPLQEAWARENGCSGTGLQIALEQIRRLKPDVVYFQDLSLATTDFLAAVRAHADLVVGQIASPVPTNADLSGFDIIFSSFPHFVDRFRSRGITAYYLPLAFDPRVLGSLPSAEKQFPVTFVGGLSAVHREGVGVLEEIARMVTVDFWGYGAETLQPGSPIRSRHHGEAWGLEMFARLRGSLITLNRHIDVAENYANNMRLFEATGCGALLITDYKDNLNDLFEIGREVVAYRSAEECAALIKYYLAHPNEAANIARAGQSRTMQDHTYAGRMEKVAEILDRHLRYKRERNRYGQVDLSKISYGHTLIAAENVPIELTSGWKNPEIPARQRGLVQQELRQMLRGKVPPVYQVLGKALRPITRPGTSVLEIGCSSGYYYEVLEYLLKRDIDYTGVDYSEAMISMATDFYPRTKFKVADGAHLPFTDGEFEIAISSCVLLHVPNYAEHIAEAVRVAKQFVIVHRTPVCRKRTTQYLKKFAYGTETMEMRFNEGEVLTKFLEHGLELVNTIEFESNARADQFDVTYVFRKLSTPRANGKPQRPANRVESVGALGPNNAITPDGATEKTTMNEIINFHRLQITDELASQISKMLPLLGFNTDDFAGKTKEGQTHLAIGKYFAKVADLAGKIASENLFKAQ